MVGMEEAFPVAHVRIQRDGSVNHVRNFAGSGCAHFCGNFGQLTEIVVDDCLTRHGEQFAVSEDLVLLELFRSLANEDQIQQNAEQKKRSALRTAIAVMLYILSPIPLITLAALAGQPIVGLVLLLTMAAVATGILIYDYMSKPTYNAKDETMVEEFRAWSSGTKRIKQTRDAVSSALWSLTVAIYLLISFSTGAWHITWIAFIFAAGVQTMVNLFFNLKGKDQS